MKSDNGKPSIESLKDKPIHTQTEKKEDKNENLHIANKT